MANITRIKNNQITDSTITYHKIVPGTLIGSLFNADLTLNSNVSIIGNLSVAGSSSSVTSTNTYVNDPLVVFNNGYSGSLTGYDIGILVNRNLTSLPGYGSVNTAWIWSEAEKAFVALATTDTGAGITNLNNSGYANVRVGSISATDLTLSGDVYANSFNGDIYATNGVITNFSTGNALITGGSVTGLTNLGATTGVITNFSTANAVITGGTITGLTDLGATTGVITNFSTANAQITGGSITGLTDLGVTTLVATNFSTGNSLITGGSITGVSGGFSTLVATNFSTANAQITGGSITGITEFGATTLYATNFSTGNALISGGYIDNTTIGFNQAANGYFSELHASGTTYLASGEDNNGLQYTSGALQVTGGVGISGNLYVQGNLFVSNIISANTSILSVTEPLLYLTADNPSNYDYEVGFYSHFIDSVYQHTGLVRDHNDYVWKLFSNVPEPVGSTVNFTNAIWDKLKLGEMFVANTTSSNSTSTGALVVNGGAGIAGNLYLGGNLFVGGNIKLAAINGTPIGNVTPSTGAFTYLTATVGFSTANALVTGGDITGLTSFEATTGVITNFSTGNAQITGGDINGIDTFSATTGVIDNFSSGNVLITGGTLDGTPIGATTASTGSFTALSATGFTYFSDTTEAITSNIGSVVMAGGLAVNKQIMVGGNLVATSTTGSTTYNTGSFVTKGGAGIAGDVYVNKGVVVNENNGANDFVAKGVNSNTLLWARSNGTYDQVLIGDTTATGGLVQGAKLQLASTDSIILPTGSTAERPGGVGYTDTIGMIRFNTTIGSVEWYNGSQWKSGATPLTVIADQQFSGDGSTVDFTLSQAATTNGIIVSINGVVQIPTLAYAVGGVGNTTLTFTEAPENGDLIDVRFITSSQTITSLASSNGIMQLVFQNNSINLYTGSGSATNTTSWNSSGAQVSKIPATTIATSGIATTIDTFDKATYRTAKYVVQATYSGSYHSQEALVVHDGSTATIVLGTAALTSGSLGTISATISGSNVVLQFTASNSGTDVRIKKDYIIL